MDVFFIMKKLDRNPSNEGVSQWMDKLDDIPDKTDYFYCWFLVLHIMPLQELRACITEIHE